MLDFVALVVIGAEMTTPDLSISVAMATYNGAKHLASQLASIAAQTRLPDEIVVGDDQSNDDTLSIIDSFRKETGLNVRVERNEARLGTIKNFEKIITRCRGDIVVFSDQDDVWRADKLETIVATFNRHPAAFYAFSNGHLMDDEGSQLPGTIWESIHFLEEEQAHFRGGRGLEVLLRQNVILGCTLAARRIALENAQPIYAYHDYRIGCVLHDYWIGCVLEAIDPGGVLIDEPLIAYRLHPAQQEGIFRLTPSKITRILNERGEAYYLREMETFRRLATISRDRGASLHQLQIIEDKIRFSERRAAMRRRPFSALWLITESLLKGDYNRFTHRQKFGGVTIPFAIPLDMACAFAAIFSRHDLLDRT
jgi:glycosyltransferase involved in cell wall biosynthesis